jgi:DNA-binding NarL/FixJ family response regulator
MAVSETRSERRSGPARIIIADDHGLVRQGFRGMLAREEGLELIGEAEDGREAVEVCSRLRPDLVLMDVRMPGMDGLSATREIKQSHPQTIVLVVTMHENPDYLLEAVKAGAAGYVLKGSPNSRIISSIRRALEGESPLDEELAMHVMHNLVGGGAHWGSQGASLPPQPRPHEERPEGSLPKPLARRELEVLRLVARGKTNQEIAQILGLSALTVKTYVQRIIGKLGVSDRTQAAVRAAQLGLLAPESV